MTIQQGIWRINIGDSTTSTPTRLETARLEDENQLEEGLCRMCRSSTLTGC